MARATGGGIKLSALQVDYGETQHHLIGNIESAIAKFPSFIRCIILHFVILVPQARNFCKP